MEEFKCPVAECKHEPFQTMAGLKSHLRTKHPDVIPEQLGVAREVPIVEEDFATLLTKFKIKGDLAANIAENISHTGGPKVFEKPELLFKRLTAWSSDVTPAKRKNIIEQWFAEKGIDISPEVQQKVGMTTEQIEKEEVATKEGARGRYIFDEKAHTIRMAKEGERGGTLEEAKELLKMDDEHKAEGAESPFMQDGQGQWVLNPKARVTGVELMAVQFMQQAQQKGEPVNPITAMTRAAETWKTLREGLGVGVGTTPTWQTDPAEFIKTVKAITGDSGGDSALKEALAEMRKSVDEMREQRYQDQFAGQQRQIQDISTILKQTLDTISDLQKGNVGRTEMDIMHEIITGGKEELSGLRKDVREAFTSTSLPPRKTAEEREGRKQQTRKALQTDQDIEELGRRMFFPQGLSS